MTAEGRKPMGGWPCPHPHSEQHQRRVMLTATEWWCDWCGESYWLLDDERKEEEKEELNGKNRTPVSA